MAKAGKLRQLRIRQRTGAGRPRKEGVERYPNGRIKHHETERDAMSVAIAGLGNVHKLNYDPSGLTGYTLGRIRIDGNISEHELAAGNWYTEQMFRYYNTVGIPVPHARAQNLFAVRGHDGEVSETRQQQARRASNMFMRLEGILLKCEEGPQVKTTVYNVCIQDMDNLRMMPEYQMGLLKRGLKALIFEMGIAK